LAVISTVFVILYTECSSCWYGKKFAVAISCVHHVTKHNTPIHSILSTAPQLGISQKAL
jgi:hypothetical protein